MRKLISRFGVLFGLAAAVALLVGNAAQAQYPYSATPNAFGGYNYSGGGYSTPNAFGGSNYSGGGYSTPSAGGGWNFWGR